MLSPETRSSTPRSARCTSAGRLDDKLEVGQAAHQEATPAPGDESAIQDRCAKVEHPFHVIKNLFRHKKARYKGMAKNEAQLFSLFGLANLVIAKRRLLALHARGAS